MVVNGSGLLKLVVLMREPVTMTSPVVLASDAAAGFFGGGCSACCVAGAAPG
jgi:hypothetical protein